MVNFFSFWGSPYTFTVYPEQHEQVYGAGGPHVWFVERDVSYAGIGSGILNFPYTNLNGFPGFNTPFAYTNPLGSFYDPYGTQANYLNTGNPYSNMSSLYSPNMYPNQFAYYG